MTNSPLHTGDAYFVGMPPHVHWRVLTFAEPFDPRNPAVKLAQQSACGLSTNGKGFLYKPIEVPSERASIDGVPFVETNSGVLWPLSGPNGNWIISAGAVASAPSSIRLLDTKALSAIEPSEFHKVSPRGELIPLTESDRLVIVPGAAAGGIGSTYAGRYGAPINLCRWAIETGQGATLEEAMGIKATMFERQTDGSVSVVKDFGPRL